jgi:hypothetical protein
MLVWKFAWFVHLGNMCHIGLYIKLVTNKYLSDIKEFEEKSGFLKICHKMYLNDVDMVIVYYIMVKSNSFLIVFSTLLNTFKLASYNMESTIVFLSFIIYISMYTFIVFFINISNVLNERTGISLM